MHATRPLLEATDFPPIKRRKVDTLQVNLGYRCNQQCQHCHVNAGPARTESMDRQTVDSVLTFLATGSIKTLDITGGAPELNEHFRYLVSETRRLGLSIIDRCNLTILNEPGQQDLAEFLRAHEVEITASLPCYLHDNVDRQRGRGVFDSSIRALQTLNGIGYGRPDSGLVLNLVYNPQGAVLPPAQDELEVAYKHHLQDNYGVTFNKLFTLTNMPINRFGSMLVSKGLFNSYMQTLRDACRTENLDAVMCRHLLSVDWRGYVYDCDFNQMLGLPLYVAGKSRPHLNDLLGVDMEGRPVAVMDHCYACTAGQGSSCGGALSED